MTYAMTLNRARLLALAGTLILAFVFLSEGVRAEDRSGGVRPETVASVELGRASNAFGTIVGNYPCDGGPNTPECKKWLKEHRGRK